MNQNSYMYKAMMQVVNERCNCLVKSGDLSAEMLYLKCLALIFVSNLRCFLREKSELEIYKLTKEIRSLNKLHANERHTLARLIMENI